MIVAMLPSLQQYYSYESMDNDICRRYWDKCPLMRILYIIVSNNILRAFSYELCDTAEL